jgi:manganese/zinc/iron transport system substrate-binding protein
VAALKRKVLNHCKENTPAMFTRLLIGLFGLILLAACSPTTQTSSAERNSIINVVTTTGMIADVVQNIGGQRVNVTQLMGAGVDPHLYTATQNDVSTLSNAQMIFYNGLHLEARMIDIFEQIGANKPVVAVTDSIPDDKILKSPNYDAPDPHVWMDASLWSMAAQHIADELSVFDPSGAETYTTNVENYLAQLAELDQYAHDQIQTIPEEQRILVTAHDAFHYFSRAYGIEVFAPQGITTAAEAGVEDIRQTIRVVVERNVPAIFVESSVPQDVVNAIVEGAAAQGQDVVIGGSLYSDAMGQPGTPDGTYIGMIRHNVDTIVKALSGL